MFKTRVHPFTGESCELNRMSNDVRPHKMRHLTKCRTPSFTAPFTIRIQSGFSFDKTCRGHTAKLRYLRRHSLKDMPTLESVFGYRIPTEAAALTEASPADGDGNHDTDSVTRQSVLIRKLELRPKGTASTYSSPQKEYLVNHCFDLCQ